MDGRTGEFENQVRATGTLAQMGSHKPDWYFRLTIYHVRKYQRFLTGSYECAICHYRGDYSPPFNRHQFWNFRRGRIYCPFWNLYTKWGNSRSEFHQNMALEMDLVTAIKEGVKIRTRPVVMTALMASTGLLPAAISTGIGSESRSPWQW